MNGESVMADATSAFSAMQEPEYCLYNLCMDHHTVAAVSITGTCFDVIGISILPTTCWADNTADCGCLPAQSRTPLCLASATELALVSFLA